MGSGVLVRDRYYLPPRAPCRASPRDVAVLTIRPTGTTTTVHNLTIRNTHNYHVLTTPTTNTDHTTLPTSILVHNDCTTEDIARDIQETARRQAARGRKDLLSTLTEEQQKAAGMKGMAGGGLHRSCRSQSDV